MTPALTLQSINFISNTVSSEGNMETTTSTPESASRTLTSDMSERWTRMSVGKLAVEERRSRIEIEKGWGESAKAFRMLGPRELDAWNEGEMRFQLRSSKGIGGQDLLRRGGCSGSSAWHKGTTRWTMVVSVKLTKARASPPLEAAQSSFAPPGSYRSRGRARSDTNCEGLWVRNDRLSRPTPSPLLELVFSLRAFAQEQLFHPEWRERRVRQLGPGPSPEGGLRAGRFGACGRR